MQPCVSRPLLTQLFHDDFKHHITALDTLTEVCGVCIFIVLSVEQGVMYTHTPVHTYVHTYTVHRHAHNLLVAERTVDTVDHHLVQYWLG